MTPIKRRLYKITATLLNSWNYLFQVDENYYKEAYESFLKTLQRIKEQPTEAMLRGIEFEKQCYDGNIETISDTIKNGAFQVYAEKDHMINGMNVRVLGYLDVLKAGTIYDIKRVGQYDLQKYFTSFQHHIYFDLIDEATKFVYLVGAGTSSVTIFQEEYTRDERIDVEQIIESFFKWLDNNDLMEVYKANWEIM